MYLLMEYSCQQYSQAFFSKLVNRRVKLFCGNSAEILLFLAMFETILLEHTNLLDGMSTESLAYTCKVSARG